MYEVLHNKSWSDMTDSMYFTDWLVQNEICKLYSLHSGPKVRSKWVLLFALLFFFNFLISDVKTWQYDETRKMVKAVWSRCSPWSDYAINAYSRKIPAVTRLLLSVFSHFEHLLLEKILLKTVYMLSSLLPLSPSTVSRSSPCSPPLKILK